MPKAPFDRRSEAARMDLLTVQPDPLSETMMEALVAAGTLIALADGHLHDAEQRCLLRAARLDPRMRFVPLYDLSHEIDARRDAFERAPEIAFEDALLRLHALRLQPRRASSVYDSCVAVALADGQLHVDELCALNRVRAALDLADAR